MSRLDRFYNTAMINPLDRLKARAKKTSPSQMAREIGVSLPYVVAVLNGRKRPSDKLLRLVGLKRVIKVTYQRL